MENEAAKDNISNRNNILLKVYIIVLAIMSLAILALTIFAFALGVSALGMLMFQTIYHALFSLITRSSYALVVWQQPSLLFTVVSLFLLLMISISIVGALNQKKWGHTVNVIFLGIIFPIFFTLPTAGFGFIPHAGDIMPFAAICPLFLFLFVFDIYYFFWFMKNRNIFTA